MTDQWASSVANTLAKSAASNADNIADTKAALAMLHDTPSIYDQMIAERRGNPYAPKD